jgi:hypothetical protein
VTVPAVVTMPRSTAAVDELLDPAHDEDVVVHREAEQEHEQEER